MTISIASRFALLITMINEFWQFDWKMYLGVEQLKVGDSKFQFVHVVLFGKTPPLGARRALGGVNFWHHHARVHLAVSLHGGFVLENAKVSGSFSLLESNILQPSTWAELCKCKKSASLGSQWRWVNNRDQFLPLVQSRQALMCPHISITLFRQAFYVLFGFPEESSENAMKIVFNTNKLFSSAFDILPNIYIEQPIELHFGLTFLLCISVVPKQIFRSVWHNITKTKDAISQQTRLIKIRIVCISTNLSSEGDNMDG